MDTNHLTYPDIFAHRGVSSLCPENTMEAFEKAVEIGARGIELDVHLSRDGKLVVCHDEMLNRTTNGKGIIMDLDYEDIRKLDAGSWFSREFTGARVPLLEDVLYLLRDRGMVLNIELKTDYFPYKGIEKKVVRLVADYDMDERIIISSFNHYSVARLKAEAPRLKAGLLYSCHIYRPAEYAKFLTAEALHPAMHTVTPEIIADAKKAGYAVNVWFYGERFDEDSARRNLASGVDCIITNFPQLYLLLTQD
jgi:glycerophosphoryl diester phosphodiesterase